MKITNKDIENIAFLGRLKLNNDDIENFTKQINTILEYVDILNKIDMTKIKTFSHVSSLNNVMRQDKIIKSLDKDLVFQNAPEEENGYFKIPKIVENKGEII